MHQLLAQIEVIFVGFWGEMWGGMKRDFVLRRGLFATEEEREAEKKRLHDVAAWRKKERAEWSKRQDIKYRLWDEKQGELRAVADRVFPKVIKVSRGLYEGNGKLIIQCQLNSQTWTFYYDNVLSKNLIDIEAEMKEDRDRALTSQPQIMIRRCAAKHCSRPVARGGYYDNRFCIYCQNTDE